MRRFDCPVDEAEGSLLAQAQQVAGRRLEKGRVIDRQIIAELQKQGLNSVPVFQPAIDDSLENPASDLVAARMAAAHTRNLPARHGRALICASVDGLIEYQPRTLIQANRKHPDFLFAAQLPGSAVCRDMPCASVKTVPLALSSTAAHAAAAAAPPIEVTPFQPRTTALLQTFCHPPRPDLLTKGTKIFSARLARFGSKLAHDLRCEHNRNSIAQALNTISDCELILVLGPHSASDPNDVVPAALLAAGGSIGSFGLPFEPGHLLILGQLKGAQVMIMPSSARSARRGSYDVVLERLHAGWPIDADSLASLGVGGLAAGLGTDRPGRPRKLAGILLAAGLSRRMGGVNKLLAQHGSSQLVELPAQVLRQAVDAGLLSEAFAVVGHEADRVAAVLNKCGLKTLENPAYAEGLASTLRCALAALPIDIDGLLVMLGDMPSVRLADIKALVRAFDPRTGSTIVVASHHGKRGNPVIIGERHFIELHDLEGDVGARGILATNAVTEVAAGPGVLRDIDLPEDL